MGIPLPRMLRQLRAQQHRAGQSPAAMRYGLKGWAFLARRPAMYKLAMRLGVGSMGALGRGKGRFAKLPLAGGWTGARDLPAPAGKTFQQMWSARGGRRS